MRKKRKHPANPTFGFIEVVAVKRTVKEIADQRNKIKSGESFPTHDTPKVKVESMPTIEPDNRIYTDFPPQVRDKINVNDLPVYNDENTNLVDDMPYNEDRNRPNVVFNKTQSKPEIKLPSKPHANGTEGHWDTILDEVGDMSSSGDYKKVYVNNGLSNEIPGAKPNRRPDVMGVRHDGTIDQVEVPSKTDDPADLLNRMRDNQRILGDRAGNIKVRPIK